MIVQVQAPHRRRCGRIVTLGIAIALSGCQSAYYGAMERIGVHKRDILVSRVEAAGEAQTQAKEQFESALERFREVVRIDGGPLETRYEQLSSELERSEAKADAVRSRIASVENVAEDLFHEWRGELALYSNAELRSASERKLETTRSRYRQLITAMRRAEGRMDPVLAVFRDQVLFLKHNLNARAIASLEGELTSVEADVSRLVREMEAAIAESEAFVSELRSNG